MRLILKIGSDIDLALRHAANLNWAFQMRFLKRHLKYLKSIFQPSDRIDSVNCWRRTIDKNPFISCQINWIIVHFILIQSPSRDRANYFFRMTKYAFKMIFCSALWHSQRREYHFCFVFCLYIAAAAFHWLAIDSELYQFECTWMLVEEQ